MSKDARLAKALEEIAQTAKPSPPNEQQPQPATAPAQPPAQPKPTQGAPNHGRDIPQPAPRPTVEPGIPNGNTGRRIGWLDRLCPDYIRDDTE